MTTNRTSQIHGIQPILLALVFFCCSLPSLAQQTQYDRGTPPQHAAGVSPLGSYTSADIGTVTLSNGALNLKFPIGSVGGRGFWMPLTLNYSSKIWSGSQDTETDRDGTTKTVAYADFGRLDDYAGFYERLRPGWTVGIAPILFNRIVRINYTNINPQGPCYHYTLPKLTLMFPDKGEIEFRDDAYDGMPLASDCSGYVAVASRGRRWHATDGSGTVYISDIDNAAAQRFGDLSGVVITSDGTRYRFSGGGCEITDRNGNKISTQNTNGITITDQLGRITTIQQNVADPQNPGVTLALLVTLPGYNGSRYYKVKTGTMNQHYRSDITPTLPVITGDYDPLGYNYGWGTATRLFNHSYGLYAQQIDIWEVPTELILPDGRSLHFNYNQYGEVAEVQMPTGGKVWYDYDGLGTFPAGNSPVWETTGDLHTQVFTDRALKQRRTFPDGSTLECTWNYSYAAPSTQVTAISATGTLMLDQRHYFLAADRYYFPPNSTGIPDGTQNTLWSTGIEYRTETRDAVGAVIAASEQDWTQRVPLVWSGYPQEQLANDNRVNEERKFLDDGSMAKVQTFYQPNVKYNNPTEVKEFDYDQTLKRRTVTTYADSVNLINGVDYTTDSIHLLSLPLAQTVYDGSNNQMTQTVNEYDIYTDDGNHAPLQDYGTVTGHDSSYGLLKTTRGNLTHAGHWLNTNNSTIYSYLRYDTVGNPVGNKDANGNLTTLSYADDFGDGSNPGGGAIGTNGATYAFPTLLTSPPPQTGQPQQTARSQYDFSTGLLTGFRDRNNIVTQTIYNDPFDRPTLVKAALGVAGVEAHTAMYYAPTTAFGITLTNNDVLTAKDQTSLDDATLRSWTHTDGFGRKVETWSRDPQGDDEVITIYDALGRASQVSNPFRPSLQETPVYTTTAYDLAGHVTSVTTPDNAVVKTAYSGNRVLVADQNTTDALRKKRISVTDGLGRLKEVWEIKASDSATESVTFPGYPDVAAGYVTRYTYDTLDDLTTVSQRIGANGFTQTRSFVYDSLKRLISATNPESGMVCYGTVIIGQCQPDGYDGNGNLLFKTDARLVKTSYTYDALNRVLTRSYSNDPTTTPTVTYSYDTSQNGKGRLASMSSSVSTYSYSSYDEMGRALSGSQTIGAQNYPMTYSYDLASHVKTMNYPFGPGHSVTYNYDTAGRVGDKDAQNLAFTGTLGDGASRSYATGISYSPFGGITIERFGTQTALYHKLQYNVRGQLWDVRVATGADVNGSWNRGCLQFFYDGSFGYGTSDPDNNGNVLKSWHYVPLDDQANTWAIQRDSYSYESLNRITSVSETYLSTSQAETTQFQESYSYSDRYGNRTIDQANTWVNGIPKPNFGVDQNTNRLTPPTGYTMSYDASGNLYADNYSGSAVLRTYDAENRMTQEMQANSYIAGTYSYDGDGRRVKRIVGGAETWQVYGFSGELLAEYAANATATSPQKEYGYRNGQLLVTLTSPLPGGSPSFSDNPIQVGVTLVKAAHVTELRTAINNLRTHLGLSTYSWTTSATISDFVSANPILEMRTALDQALGAPAGGYAAGLAQGQLVKAIHIQELRDRITAASGSDVRWLVPDQLGTPRIVLDNSGSLANVTRHDYLPFGEELGANVGGRTTAQGYGQSDGIRQQFTGQQRDNETGLDYFGARYYGSTQGRFTSADDFLNDTRVADPASWNLYAYVRNNPLRYVDPLGQTIEETEDKKHKLTKDEKKAIEKDLRAKTGLSSIHFEKNGKLTYDVNEKAQGGSAQLRQTITGAINDTKNVFQVGDYSGSENIQFALTDAGTVLSNTGVTTYQVKIDFADFRDAKNLSDSDALNAFSLGLTLDHEIDHKVSYDPSNPVPIGGRPDDGPNGVIADVNVAQSQLGLATRAPGSHTGQPYSGPDSRYKNTYQIQFNDASGKSKFVRWKLENQR